MAAKFQNKYRIPWARMHNWDYGTDSAYFITICTHNKFHFFGKIVERQFVATDLGQLAENIWLEIPDHFPYIKLGNFVVIPNHMHGVLIIDKHHDLTKEAPPNPPGNGGFAGDKNPMNQENISRIIRWHKGRCSFEMRQICIDFAWQSRFHDHIIRNAHAFENIQNYIMDNPSNWEKDKLM